MTQKAAQYGAALRQESGRRGAGLPGDPYAAEKPGQSALVGPGPTSYRGHASRHLGWWCTLDTVI